MCISALERAQSTAPFERLMYCHIRLQEWQNALSAAQYAAAAGLYNEAMHRLVTKAITQLGDAADTNHAETLARFEAALR